MSNRSAAKRAPIVRLPPKSGIEIVLSRAAQIALIGIGLVAFIFALDAGEYILAPIGLGIVIGLMLGPVATRLERRGLSPSLSAFSMLLLFLVIVSLLGLALAAPLTFWMGRLPEIWNALQRQLSELRGPIETILSMREQLRAATGGDAVAVSVQEGIAVGSVAALAPAVIGQILLFFASLYFFLATRHETRTAILKLCIDRRLRWRVAHIFRDVEQTVSRYLLSISIINLFEGIAVWLGLAALGVPSAALWGALAAVTNFVVFIGPAVMVLVLIGIGLAEFDTLAGSLLPVLLYLGINLIEAQFVTPMVIGRTMTLNPFIVLLALVFWIWLWGPLGGFVAIPALLVAYAVIRNIVPGVNWGVDEIDAGA
jgi:predicted PurR-regulated permease PerM